MESKKWIGSEQAKAFRQGKRLSYRTGDYLRAWVDFNADDEPILLTINASGQTHRHQIDHDDLDHLIMTKQLIPVPTEDDQ